MNFKLAWDEYSKKIESGYTFDTQSLSDFLMAFNIPKPLVTINSVGNGLSLECFMIESGTKKALFPIYTVQMDGFKQWSSRFTAIKSMWEYIDWFIPPYIMNGHIESTMAQVFNFKNVSQERAQENFEHAITALYTIPDMCVFVEQVVPHSVVLSNHTNTLRESILSYYTGYKSAATASLIPIVESALQQLVNNQGVKGDKIKEKVENLIENAISKVNGLMISNDVWVDEQFKTQDVTCKLDERAMMFRIFGDWLKNSFFSNSKHYNKSSGLNRHIFSHGLSLVWQRPTNFHRLIGVLNSLIFLEYYFLPGSKIGLFYPVMNDQSSSLLDDIHMRMGSQIFYNLKASDKTLKTGAKMPILTNDDGWYLRAARLGELCMSGLVEKLRDKEWCCIIGDPVKEGEFIKVEASKKERLLKIGLLYTCATSNSVYKILEGECDVILYLGAPYRQNEYAYGINKHVGPLQAWVIPD